MSIDKLAKKMRTVYTPRMARRSKSKINYAEIPTEKSNPRTRDLDRLPVFEILRSMNREDAIVAGAVKKVIPAISRAAGSIVASLRRNGKLFFVGAGTSGRLGVMEAAECPPTFNTSPSLVRAIMAGGRGSVFKSKEGAEDRKKDAERQIGRLVSRGDVVVGIAASGVTPFVAAALAEARRRKAKTVLITCHPHPVFRSAVDILIAPRTGPEVISGSTRLKAGTATKLVLNMLTVASMVKLGKVYGNRMVDLVPRSVKLKERALRLIQELGRVSRKKAEYYYQDSGGRTKLAILMARRSQSKQEAERLLKKCRHFLRPALCSP